MQQSLIRSKLDTALLLSQALLSGGAPKPGARMLIQGGAGGVGHFAIQLAKAHFKAYVVATGGSSNQGLMKVLHSFQGLPSGMLACACWHGRAARSSVAAIGNLLEANDVPRDLSTA